MHTLRRWPGKFKCFKVFNSKFERFQLSILASWKLNTTSSTLLVNSFLYSNVQ